MRGGILITGSAIQGAVRHFARKIREIFLGKSHVIKYGHYYQDSLGSVAVITGNTGNVTDTYDFDEFGTQTFNQGTTANTYRYTGQQSDADSSLYYLRARYYEPSTGRFISQDPKNGTIKDPSTFNLYHYVKNNPLRYSDPSGKSPEFIVILFAVAAVGGYEIVTSWCSRGDNFPTDKEFTEIVSAYSSLINSYHGPQICDNYRSFLLRYLPGSVHGGLNKYYLQPVSQCGNTHFAVGIADKSTNKIVAVLDPFQATFLHNQAPVVWNWSAWSNRYNQTDAGLAPSWWR